jgi:hypothetical protein
MILLFFHPQTRIRIKIKIKIRSRRENPAFSALPLRLK